MPAKDIHHEAAKSALIKDGWTITHDPLEEPIGRLLLEKKRLQLVVFHPEREEILRWVRWTQTGT